MSIATERNKANLNLYGFEGFLLNNDLARYIDINSVYLILLHLYYYTIVLNSNFQSAIAFDFSM